MIGLQQPDERPVYVEFYLDAQEDRDQTIEEGRPVYVDVPMARITPPGGNLIVEKNAEQWLGERRNSGDPFYRHYRESFEAWTEDREAPIEGTRIEDWPSATPAQVKQIKQSGLRTVEDLAVANEDSLRKIGIGARALKDRAASWLASATNTGKVAEENAALKARVDDMAGIIERLEGKIEVLEADKPKRGRAKKEP